jgi:hypothetical protein
MMRVINGRPPCRKFTLVIRAPMSTNTTTSSLISGWLMLKALMTDTAANSITWGLILAAVSASRHASTSSLVAPPTKMIVLTPSLSFVLPSLSGVFAASLVLAASDRFGGAFRFGFGILRALPQLERIEIVRRKIAPQIAGAVEFERTLDFLNRNRRKLSLADHR